MMKDQLDRLEIETSTRLYRIAQYLGFAAALSSIALWVWFEFHPLMPGNDRASSLFTFGFVAFPAILAIIAILINGSGAMLSAAAWAVPAAALLISKRGVIPLFINVPALYFIAAILMALNNRSFKRNSTPPSPPPDDEP